jgi:hypothetical protein
LSLLLLLVEALESFCPLFIQALSKLSVISASLLWRNTSELWCMLAVHFALAC